MSFSSYKSLATTLKAFQITYDQTNFLTGSSFPVSENFRADLEFMMREGVVDNSEFAICENLVYPVLKEVWKPYHQQFLWWSHQSLTYDETLAGFPEYILARRSPLGKIVFDQPYFILVEAKQDNFDAAWGQCLAEMVAAQRLNELPMTVFGITSNGDRWQFGKLIDQTFTLNATFYTIQELDKLFAVLNEILLQCQNQLEHLMTV
ncbi:MAG: hypothetical protein RLZZ511_1739 [Cyanobacteriota bacterium]|jgi:hypothetical protein